MLEEEQVVERMKEGDEVVMGGWVFGPAGLILWSGSTPMRKRRMGPWPTLGR